MYENHSICLLTYKLCETLCSDGKNDYHKRADTDVISGRGEEG